MNKRVAGQTSKVLIALASCMALQMTSFVMILPLFARRFEIFGSGVAALSASAMAYALTSTVAAPIVGGLADRYGRRPIILFSLFAYVLAFTGYLLAASSLQMILLRGLAGALTAGLIPAMMSVVGDLAPENRRGQWIGIVNGGASAGWIVGPLLGGLLYDHFGYVVPFTTSILMAICTLLVAYFWIPETHTPSPRQFRVPSIRKPAWAVLPSGRTFILVLLITFGVMFSWAFVEPQLMFYAYEDLNWSSARLGLVMSAYGIAFMLGEFALGQLSDRLGRKPVLVLGLVLFSAQFIGLVLFRNINWIAVSFVLAGLGNALYDPALSAIVLDIAPSETTAGMIGLKSTAGSLGNLLGPALAVLLTSFTGPQVVFLTATAEVFVLILIAGLVLRLPGKIEVPHQFSEAALKQ